MSDHRVVEDPVGGWAVRGGPGDREVGHHGGQDAAIREACARIRDTGGGRLAVQDRHGRTWHRHTIGARGVDGGEAARGPSAATDGRRERRRSPVTRRPVWRRTALRAAARTNARGLRRRGD